jgi:hypothetical protein
MYLRGKRAKRILKPGNQVPEISYVRLKEKQVTTQNRLYPAPSLPKEIDPFI